jgi:hypothetical protein
MLHQAQRAFVEGNCRALSFHPTLNERTQVLSLLYINSEIKRQGERLILAFRPKRQNEPSRARDGCQPVSFLHDARSRSIEAIPPLIWVRGA